MKYIIEGGKKLAGEVKISGNKNSVLPCMAAAILTSEEVILENVPTISDVEVMGDILKTLGIRVERVDNTVKIKALEINSSKLPDELVQSLRASVLLMGPLLSRLGKVSLTFPGGDIIGKRSVYVHLKGFGALGGKVSQNDLNLSIEINKQATNDISLFLDEASVTATENMILASVLGSRSVEIRNAACEQHVIDLCRILTQMGAKIYGIGTNRLRIEGVSKLSGTRFQVGDDAIEIATYAIAAAITGGKVKINCDPQVDIEPIIINLVKFGLQLQKIEDGFEVKETKLVGVHKIVTNIWPGFPTDLMSAAIVLATQATGETLCHDWMYESRMFFVDKLISMGADIIIADPHRVVVYGPCQLKARDLETPDIRAGMALVLAALIAEGKSIIHKAELIERGYEDVVGKLKGLGAKIDRIS